MAKNNLGAVVYCKVLCEQTKDINYSPHFLLFLFVSSGKPVMIVIEYMENGSLDAFLRVSLTFGALEAQRTILFRTFLCIGWKCPTQWAVWSRIRSAHKSCARAAGALWPTFPSWSVKKADPPVLSLCHAETRRPVHCHPVGGDAARHSGGNEISVRYGIRPSRSGCTEHSCQQQPRM